MRDKIASCKTFLPFNAFLSTEGIVLTFIQNRGDAANLLI